MAAQQFTVLDAMVICEIDNNAQYNGNTQAERIASDVFDDDFQTCIDKTGTELDSDFKDYSVLTANQGQIRLRPSQKKNVKAFLHWVKHKYRINEDPSNEEFNIALVPDIIRRAKSHKAYVDKSKTISDTATPDQFTNKLKWTDWLPTFRNFLRAIPGRNDVPLSYVIRDTPTIIQEHYDNYIDEYIDKAPLEGPSFTIDAAEVHTYLVKFISASKY